MKNTTAPRILFCSLALVIGTAHAQPGRPPRLPPDESLVLVPGIDAAHAREIRRIEAGRRDAHDQLAIRQRGEHARIDDEADDTLRKQLGDERYRDYIRWKSTSMRPPRPGRAPGDGPTTRAGLPDAVTPAPMEPPAS